MRVRAAWIGVLVALLLTGDSALAANQTVSATAANEFTPAAVTVIHGGSVTWNNVGGGLHNVRFDDNSFTQPAMPDSSSWTASRVFTTEGTFRYYCELHGGPGGQGMSGTVTVQHPALGPAPPLPVGADTIAPALTLGGRTKQRILRRRAVVVAVEVGEASSVVAKGTVAVPGAGRVFRLRKASKQLTAGRKATLELKVSKRTSRAFRRALARRTRLTAKLTVTARDLAGNTRSAKRQIKLRK